MSDNNVISVNATHDRTTTAPKKKRREKGILGVRKGSPMLFSFNGRELWSDDDNEDTDYVPDRYAPNTSAQPIATKKANGSDSRANQSTRNGFIDANDNGLTVAAEDRIVAPIKISKMMSKKKVNWSIVADDEAGADSGHSNANHCADLNCVNANTNTSTNANTNQNASNSEGVSGNTLPVKKRGRKKKVVEGGANSFVVTDASFEPKNGKKVKSKRMKTSQSERKNGFNMRNDSNDDNCVLNNMTDSGNVKTKLNASYKFECLLQKVDINFEQILPSEILIKIFNLVLNDDKDRMQSIINLSQVCESWRQIVITTPLLWQSLDLHSFPDERTVRGGFNSLCEDQLFANVRELNLNSWNGVYAERVLDNITTNSGLYLREISLKSCRNISAKVLQTISTHCPNIELLDISAITAAAHQNSQSPFATPVFRPFLETCGSKLLTLNLSENRMPSFPNCISTIMEFCSNLRALDISNIDSLTKTASIAVERLQNACPQLRVLRAANITLTSSSAISSPGFVHLQELSIPSNADHSTAIFINAHTDDVVEQLTKSAEKLKLIDIRGARYLTARALVKIPSWNIQHLSVSNCPKLQTAQLEMAFTKWNKSLIDVDLSWNICEASITGCLRSLYEIRDESQLRTIQLRGSAVSFSELKKLMALCTKLESIDLQSCRGLPRGIKRSYSGQEYLTLREEVLEGRYD